jgi:hypothetical protein
LWGTFTRELQVASRAMRTARRHRL